MKAEDLKAVISGMLEASERDAVDSAGLIKDNKLVIEAMQAVIERNCDHFYYRLLYPIEQAIEGVIRAAGVQDDAAIFILQNSSFIEAHFQRLFDQFEGMACCADKSRTVVRRLLRFYADGRRIEFDYAGEYTYHLPKTIFREHDEIIEFFEGLRRLFSGYSDMYLAALLKVTTKGAQSEKVL